MGHPSALPWWSILRRTIPMKTKVLLAWLLVSLWMTAFAQESDCKRVVATAAMARANSVATLQKAKQQAGDDYRANLVFAYRNFLLRHRMKSAAERLLELIPKNEGQQEVVMTLGDSLCQGETPADMRSLSRVSEALARQFTKAVKLAPEFLPAYIGYSLDAVADSHSDYAVQMKCICQQNHQSFMEAIKRLPADKQDRFAKYVMKPNSCSVVAIPEAHE